MDGDKKSAQQCYKFVCLYPSRTEATSFREALQVESSCIQAVYNLGIVSRESGDPEGALSNFYKLNNMLRNNVQVLTQLASLCV